MFSDDHRPAKSHVEAYPRFNVREARKQALAGRSIISWRNGRGEIIGVGAVQMPDANRMTIDYQFRKTGHIKATQSTVALECSTRALEYGQTDFLTSCPKCGTTVRTLLFLDYDCTCVHCQPLAYRSKMIGDLVRKSERLADLDFLIALGRPKGMHKSTFLKFRNERYLLNLELGDHRGKARPVYEEVVTSSWLPEGVAAFDVEDVLPPNDQPGTSGTGGHGDESGDDGGQLSFVGSRLFAGPSLAEALDAQLLVLAAKELSAMSAEGVVPTAMRLRKRLAAKTFDPPTDLRRGETIGVVGGAEPDVLQAQYSISFSGNHHYFFVAPDRPVTRHPVAIVTEGALLLKTTFKRDEARFIPAMIEEECELIERMLMSQRQAVEDYNRAMRAHVRRVVNGHWDALMTGNLHEAADGNNAATSG